MGVIFLYTFICKQVPNGVVDVNILEEIKEFKRKTNKTPIICIDLFSLMGLTSNEDDYYFHENGRYKMGTQTKQCEELYKKLIEAGAKLVFFTDSTVLDHKFETWSIRRNKEYENVPENLDKIYKGTDDFNLDVDSLTLQMNWEIIAANYGELNHSIDNECDLELAAYATKNNVLAVLADDSDFLIFEGQWRYWSTKEINDVTFVTKEFNRIALRNHLKLTEKQMPLLATLNGNDIIKSERLLGYHKKINAMYKRRFGTLAKCINSYPENIDSSMIAEIARKALPREKNIALKDFMTSLDSYNIFKLKDGGDNGLLELMKQEGFFKNYQTLSGHAELLVSNSIDSSIFNYNELVIPIIRRKFGILFQHKNNPNHRCLIYVRKAFRDVKNVQNVFNADVKYSVVKDYILPEYPSFTIPPLTAFYSEDTESLAMIRWKLLYWCLSPNTKELENDKKIKNEFLLSYFCVRFLRELNCIKDYEEKAILLTIISVKTKGYASIEDDYYQPIPRTVHLTFLFALLFDVVRECFEACGFKTVRDTLFQFDGVLFNEIYFKLEREMNDSSNIIKEERDMSYLYNN